MLQSQHRFCSMLVAAKAVAGHVQLSELATWLHRLQASLGAHGTAAAGRQTAGHWPGAKWHTCPEETEMMYTEPVAVPTAMTGVMTSWFGLFAMPLPAFPSPYWHHFADINVLKPK